MCESRYSKWCLVVVTTVTLDSSFCLLKVSFFYICTNYLLSTVVREVQVFGTCHNSFHTTTCEFSFVQNADQNKTLMLDSKSNKMAYRSCGKSVKWETALLLTLELETVVAETKALKMCQQLLSFWIFDKFLKSSRGKQCSRHNQVKTAVTACNNCTMYSKS